MEGRSWVVIVNNNEVSPIIAKTFIAQGSGSRVMVTGKPLDEGL